MSKLRFTDAEKWRDPWYQSLPLVLKALWQYLVDNCDNAGVWVVNRKEAEFHIGERIDWDTALQAFEGRISPLNGSKWHVVKFISFQYPGGLSVKSAPHRQVKRLLATHGLPGEFKDETPTTHTPTPQPSLQGRLQGSPIGVGKDVGVGKDSPSTGSPEGVDPADFKNFEKQLGRVSVARGPVASRNWWELTDGNKHARTLKDRCAMVRWCVEQTRRAGGTASFASDVASWAADWRP
jgi:hypothetical protein